DTVARLAAHSPSGRVPVLKHDGIMVWDSLAIVEYLAESFPTAGLWPSDRAARAHARAMCAEMHAGFSAMPEKMSMHPKRAPGPRGGGAADPAIIDDSARLQRMWRDCQDRFGARQGGGFLFGRPTAADCFFAPVVTRFRTYAVAVDDATRAYMESIEKWAPF